MKKWMRRLLRIIGVILISWTLLTVVAQIKGKEQSFQYGKADASQKALIVYDPDPFYNLDEQVCRGFAEGLVVLDWSAQVATVAAAEEMEEDFDLYVFCANTYNWAPDWALSKYIKNLTALKDKEVVAITLGGGSTQRAKRLLENLIKEQGGILLDSKDHWLWRPNDELRMQESNTAVAVDMVRILGEEVGSGKISSSRN